MNKRMSPRQIILVDDEPRLLNALRRRLSSTFDIVTFERGQDALAYLSGTHNVAVIVADMQMPEMNGVELLTQVYQRDPDIRRIMLTGNSDQETASAAINDARVLRFIRKPCDALVLKGILREALEEFEFKKSDLTLLTSNAPPKATVSQAQQTFLSVMSDELRTPLSQIISISDLLVKNGQATDAKTLTAFLTHIHESGKSVLKHVDRVLRYTRLQYADVKAGERENLDIVDTVQNIIAASEKDAKERLASISFETRRRTAFIQGSPKELSIAINEVLTNAVQYTEVGGHIGVLLRSNNEKIALRISNANSQPNTSERFKSKNVFKHGSSGLDGSNSGLGLGLSLVKLIARRNNFLFDIRDNAHGATVVTFIFDRTECPSSCKIEQIAAQAKRETTHLVG